MTVQQEEDKVLLINKPISWTSFDVVGKLRSLLKIKKIGHAGTLDPLASGLLIIGTGKKTKELSNFQSLDKVYIGEFEIGKVTASYDLETEVEFVSTHEHLNTSDFENARIKLTGDIQQVPPIFSALKIKGTRAYHFARKGNKKEIQLAPRGVIIHSFEIDIQKLPIVNFTIHCSKGTYIRSIAHDFGQLLGVGAYLRKLTRVAIGKYLLEDALEISDIETQINAGS